jgi:ABC-type multidrug transport system fused ATPase/permease subunit
MNKIPPQAPIVERSLLSWVFSVKTSLQVLLFSIILINVFVRVIPLEMQKRIVNDAISLSKIRLLFIYSGIYLVAVLGSNGLKFLINIFQTYIGQRAGAEMRKELYHRILTLPLSFFRKTQPGMVVSSIVTELATAGDFIGMAVTVPLSNILTLLAFTGYLLWLNPILGLLSFAIYPLSLVFLAILQKRANQANNDRVDASRKLSSKIAESVAGIHEIQGNGAFHIENRKYDGIVDELKKIRIIWNLYRLGIKVCTNFFTSFSQFLIFILGGYLTIKGRLDLGALVVFLSTQEKLYDPWKELVDFYQAYQDASVSYYRTMEYFDVAPEYAIEPKDRRPFELDASIEVMDLSFTAEGDIRLLDDINFSLKPGELMALVGFSGSGKSTLAHCIGQLYKYTGGQILIGKKDVADLTKKDIVQNLGFVSQTPFIFDGTFEENLLYACAAKNDGTGPDKDESMPNLDERIEVLQQTGVYSDVLRFGLYTTLDPEKHGNLLPVLVRLRKIFQENYGESLEDRVEFFDENKYLYYSSLAKNITFGTANEASFTENNLSQNEYFLRFLADSGLMEPLLNLGAALCNRTVDILGDLPPDEIFFEKSLIRPDELDAYKIIAERVKKAGLQNSSSEDRKKILGLALLFTPGIHKMVPLPEVLEKRILTGHFQFREKIESERPESFSFYDINEYICSHSILNNIFFGKIKTTTPQIQDKINQLIVQLLIEEGILETIIEIGMGFQVGSKGDRLSGGQRQKLAVARALLKKPKILILDEATSALDNKSQARIQHLLETRWKGKSTVIAVVHRLDIVKNYDKIAVMKTGKIGEIGGYDELMAGKGMLYELTTGRNGD